MNKNKNESREITNVEFGNEFGDLNNAKMYEIAFSNQKEKQQQDNKKNREK